MRWKDGNTGSFLDTLYLHRSTRISWERWREHAQWGIVYLEWNWFLHSVSVLADIIQHYTLYIYYTQHLFSRFVADWSWMLRSSSRDFCTKKFSFTFLFSFIKSLNPQSPKHSRVKHNTSSVVPWLQIVRHYHGIPCFFHKVTKVNEWSLQFAASIIINFLFIKSAVPCCVASSWFRLKNSEQGIPIINGKNSSKVYVVCFETPENPPRRAVCASNCPLSWILWSHIRKLH